MRRTTVATIGAIAAVGAFGVGAGTAFAAPAERPLSVEQVPNAGVTVGANGITGGFVASILASATEPGVTLITLNTTPTESCATNLKDARVGITWKNTSTGASGDEVFAACADGRPSDGVAVTTGAGSVEFTTTILGQGDQTFTVVPGSGSFTR
ncbi:hypothetical protein P9A14_18385 [Gordonia hongkongensis]|uniref:Uncharacterized protein n=1 Tax=Gordonia hongkongensis TaxID=1701090 RepID=A0AAX3T5Z2_9ACTN|nr:MULTISPECIES: hypothetical protein [Gordonia]QIK46901.1 hypothetical protein G8C36_06375 [Gordonia terrae]WFP24082.1 hypothetical protein P9A14_18385 [Gordonia hongkongensis]